MLFLNSTSNSTLDWSGMMFSFKEGSTSLDYSLNFSWDISTVVSLILNGFRSLLYLNDVLATYDA